MLLASFRTNGVLIIVFIVLFLTFLALTIGELASSDGIHKLGGYLGIVTAALAWYGAAAGVMNNTAKRVVFPVFPR